MCEWIVSPLVLFCAHAKVKELLLLHPIESSVFCFAPLKGSCISTRGRGGRSTEGPRSRNQTVCSLEYYLTVAVFPHPPPPPPLVCFRKHGFTLFTLFDIVTENYQLQWRRLNIDLLQRTTNWSGATLQFTFMHQQKHNHVQFIASSSSHALNPESGSSRSSLIGP